MGLRYSTISFLSDYGTTDEFVGVVHSVVRSIDDAITMVDISHQIAPHDVRAGGLMLARCAQYLHPGVVLAVVDPGVGTDRRPIAVEVGDGMSVLVGPDNGLLAPAVAMVGGASRAVELTNTELHLPAPGPTFDGRDIFAPVAANLCRGVPFDELGNALEPSGLMPAVVPISNLEDGRLTAEVLWIDQFGNAQLNVSAEDTDELLGDRVSLTLRDLTRTARRVHAYGDIAVGEIGLVVDSYGLLALTALRSSAAQELSLADGDQVVLSRAPDDNEQSGAGVTVGVQLGRRPNSNPGENTEDQQ